jgi:hypothetical protein
MRLFSSSYLFFSILLSLSTVLILSKNLAFKIESIATPKLLQMAINPTNRVTQEDEDICHFQECVPGGTRAS